MPAVGGSIETLTLNGRVFPVDASVEVNRKLGGWENEVLANGDSSARLIKTRVPMSLDGVTVEIDDGRQDHEFLQQLSDSTDFFALDITYASGITYQGKGQIVGELQSSSQSATAAVSIMGPGILTRQ